MDFSNSLKDSSNSSFLERRATRKIDYKSSNLPFHKLNKTKALISFSLGILINFLSAASAGFGGNTLLSKDPVEALVPFLVIFLVLSILEYIYRELSDSIWDEWYLFKEVNSKKVLMVITLFVVSATISCLGISKAYYKYAAPDPHFVALNSELKTNVLEIANLKKQNEDATKDPTKRVDGKMKNPIYYNEVKNMSTRDKTKNNLIERNAELRKKINSSEIPMTDKYAVQIEENKWALILIFITLAVFYQMLMAFNSKYDASLSMNENPEKYIKAAKKQYPKASKEKTYQFIENYFNAYPEARKIYNQAKKKESYKAERANF